MIFALQAHLIKIAYLNLKIKLRTLKNKISQCSHSVVQSNSLPLSSKLLALLLRSKPSALQTSQEVLKTPLSIISLTPSRSSQEKHESSNRADKLKRESTLTLQATTQTDYRVLDAMLPFMTNMFGNPHSKSHEYGWETEKAVENARAQIASLIGAEPKEIIFTSGATESNNMALKGLAKFYKKKKHIITTQIEHKCVLDTCRHLEEEGYEVTYLPVQPNGLVDLELLERTIRYIL